MTPRRGRAAWPPATFAIQGDDYFSAVNGRTPLVNYISQYANLLPLALEPVLKAAGPSITSLSISMCVLSAIAMIAIYGAFAVVTRGAWTALALYVPWVALSLFPWNDVGPYREFNGIYYGVFPGRYFGPFLLALLCAISLRRAPALRLRVVSVRRVGPAQQLRVRYRRPARPDRRLRGGLGPRPPATPGTCRSLYGAAAGLLTAIALVCAITLIRTGELPDPALLTYYNRSSCATPSASSRCRRSACTGLSTPRMRRPCWSQRCASFAVSRTAS